jgi:glycosyltransferase involved in cell wall biosynthesis
VARILQVCNTDFYLSKFLAPLVNALVARGHAVECICEGGNADRRLLDAGVPVHPFSFPRGAAPVEFGRAIARMRKVIRAGGYECVNGHNRNASIVARVAAWLEGVPVNLYTAHGFYFHDGQGRVSRAMTVALEAALSKITHYTLSQSTEDVAFMTGRGHIARDRIEVIGNGIDTQRFRPRPGERERLEQRLGLRPGRFRIASTGRLVRGKGFGDLLDAFARLGPGNAELLIIGGNIAQDISPYHAQFMEQARALGLASEVVVTGLTDRVEDYLGTCDAFVLPSYREGLPRALLEAMAAELPVLATNIRGCREVVRDGDSGHLFEPRDIAALARLLERLRGSPELRETLGRRGRALIVAQFDERQYVSRQVGAIERLLGAARAAPATP